MRYVFVLNERAGRPRCRAMLAAIHEVFAEDEVEIVSDPETAAAIGATRSARQVLVAVGGDGTVNRLLPLASLKGIALGILPAGTANDLARALGIPADPREACRILRAGARRSLDLLAVNGMPFATCGGVGLAADAAAAANRWRARAGWGGSAARAAGRIVYAIAAAREAARLGRGCRVEVEWDRGRMAAPLLAAFASNIAVLGGRYRIAPRAKMDDGLFDVCLLPAQPVVARRAMILRAAIDGSVLSIPGARQVRTRSLVMHTEEPVLFFGDGEILARGTAFTIEVRRGALHVVVPGARAQTLPREKAA